jgi:hypothetical protein
MPMYHQLDAAQITRTIEQLRERIGERFPTSNLRHVCKQLLSVANEVSECVDYLRRPNWNLRVIGGVAILGLVALLVAVAGLTVRAPGQVSGIAEIIQTIEAGVNDVVFFGVAVYFLLTIETRAKRRRALAAIHKLRSLSHIVDMHQLTKDPERLLSRQPDTPSSPQRTMSAPELGRYLDYCSELLSLTSKVAALLVQHFNDSVVLAAVNEIEELTTGLSGKIWQKITILERIPNRETPVVRSAAAARL